ncbi:Activating signal cointegrator 1 [Fasciolopsis buskii]|uniref:Activating signal cointegrator 1 n=1 Tax=Fasciolopsis buskii TaxID=27845 RepID=A0A8E0VGS3_9TREM|nr:Activating signal cointegrator 1 [Fasciolopsis buski]
MSRPTCRGNYISNGNNTFLLISFIFPIETPVSTGGTRRYLRSSYFFPKDSRDEAARQLYNPTQSEIGDFEATVRAKLPSSAGTDPRAMDESRGIVDPTLGIRGLEFVRSKPTDQVERELNHGNRHSLVDALRQPLAELRLQDDSSRQLTDEGYCLSMHQPWASFLVRGIKKDEGRVWYTTHRGPLWIASTAKPPDPSDIESLEKDYIASGGSKDDLPSSYPIGCLLGRVNVVDVLSQEQYRAKFPDGSSTSPFVFICDDPREVLLKFPLSGRHKIYKLDSHLHIAASKNLA